MEKIQMIIQCPSCKGTGIYQGMAEAEGIAVVCYKCEGTGAYQYKFSYEKFTGRKIRKDIDRVYLSTLGYKLGRGVIDFQGIGKIDMDKQGVSYAEFLSGKMPKHIKKLGCPMLVDQNTCHKIKGFVDRCNSFNDGWLNYIPECNNRSMKHECWDLFEKST